MKGTLVRALSLASLLAPLCGCKVDLFGTPPRPSTHGYQAVMTIRSGTSVVSFDVALRGEAFRRALGPGENAHYLLRVAAAGPVYEVDPSTGTYWETAPKRLLEGLDGFPIKPGFSEKAEAVRRSLTDYARESDAVFAGHACAIWRFDDHPDALSSSATSYWVSPALDKMVVKMERTVPGADGSSSVTDSIELTSIRPGASPELLALPAGFRKVEPPAAGR